MTPGASKIEASGVQNGLLEASWGLLEAKSAKDGRTSPPKPASGRLLGRPEALPKWSWSILGGSWGRLGPPGEETTLGAEFGRNRYGSSLGAENMQYFYRLKVAFCYLR